MAFDLEAHLRAYDGSGAKANAKQEIQNEIIRLELLQPALDAYKEIASRQAREIAELSIVIESFRNTPRAVELSNFGLDAVRFALKEAITEYYDQMEASIDFTTPPPSPIEEPQQKATSSELIRHMEKQDVSWADAWNYFRDNGYYVKHLDPYAES